MALISVQNLSIAFGGAKILDDISFIVEKKQRICLLGRNGAGKSTLLKILSGKISPDTGTLVQEKTLSVSSLLQEIPGNLNGTVFEIIAAHSGHRGELLMEYLKEERKITADPDRDPERLQALQAALDADQGWKLQEEIRKITTRMSLNPDSQYQALSGGGKRRTLLAAALTGHPDVLLLDEPTNHLDIDAIEWLEEYLLQMQAAIIFVTHDRMLLRRLATRIIELDRGKLVDWSCDYDTFVFRKQAVLNIQEKEWKKFDRKLAAEEAWLRRGIKARRTRNEGRVKALMKMRAERKLRRYQAGAVSLSIDDSIKSGKQVIKAKDIHFSYDKKPLISGFSTIIMRGDKVGVIGPNGCGKTTLINILLGKLKPHSGSVHIGTHVEIAVFDQMREQLDTEKSLWENILPAGDTVFINGKPRHIVSYLGDFLFAPDRIRMPVRNLSGGEKNRLLLARLFTRPANLLVLDEPTNDLDVETLEILESLLVHFDGTVILISHDRTFLNNVATSTLVFTGNSAIVEFIGGYDAQRAQPHPADAKAGDSESPEKHTVKRMRKSKPKVKLTYNESREIQLIPDKIERLEEEQSRLYSAMSDVDFFRDKEQVVKAKSRLAELETELENLYARWEYLDQFTS